MAGFKQNPGSLLGVNSGFHIAQHTLFVAGLVFYELVILDVKHSVPTAEGNGTGMSKRHRGKTGNFRLIVQHFQFSIWGHGHNLSVSSSSTLRIMHEKRLSAFTTQNRVLEIGGRQRESNLPGNGCRPQPGLKPGRATGRDCLPLNHSGPPGWRQTVATA
jgi:hypothetical protein